MKTTIFTMVAVMIMAVVTTTNTYANVNNNNEEATNVLTNVSKINKIEVHGNVELYVSDGTADQVKVYNKYYSEGALVQGQNGVLRIASYKNQKLVVWVTAADLQSITAYDNAEVKSFGKLQKVNLEVNLYNTATADLNVEAYIATVNVNDNAKVNLTGNVNDYNLTCSQPANVTHKDFIALNTTAKTSNIIAKATQSELAGL